MRTFVDPRLDGGKLNERTHEDLVRTCQIAGEEWLRYKSFPIQIALLRGTTADPAGNITMEREALTLDNAGDRDGRAQFRGPRHCAGGTDCRRGVAQSARGGHPRSACGLCRARLGGKSPCRPMARRITTPIRGRHARAARSHSAAAPETSAKSSRGAVRSNCRPGGVVDLGIGMPEGVAAVAAEERVLRYLTLTAEPGIIGGLPQGGLDFGAALNPEAVLHQNQQFDFYDGGGLDLACLGMGASRPRW